MCPFIDLNTLLEMTVTLTLSLSPKTLLTMSRWTEDNDQLSASYTFRDFTEAFAFMTEVAFHAEKMNHHPNWSNVWNTVDIHLNTHDAGNTVTEKDLVLARVIDKIYSKFDK